MKLFLLGDFASDNGPGNANKQIRDTLAGIYGIEYSCASGKYARVMEMYKGVRRADILLICSRSNINYLAVIDAKKRGKKVIYLMHGWALNEAMIEDPHISARQLNAIKRYEVFVYGASDRIVCVSERFMVFMEKQFPQYGDKLDYIYNAVDVDQIKDVCRDKIGFRRGNTILSAGGGMRRKNNLAIARAVSRIPARLEYTVVGEDMEDGEEIRKYESVTWIRHLSHDALLQMMGETDLYIQNSTFETFGLAVIEALYAGCSLLISHAAGCLELFETVTDADIIYDTSDEEEISDKIQHLLQEPNNKRLLSGFREEWVSGEYQGSRWREMIQKMEK